MNSWLYVFYSVNKHNMKLTSHQPCDSNVINSNVNVHYYFIISIMFAVTNLIITYCFSLSVFPSTQQCDVSIQINSNTPINTSLSTSHKVAAPILRTLYVGGLPPGYLPLVAAMRSEHIDGFDGCMRHLQVNNDERLLFQDATRGQNIDDCDVPMCSFRPCLNNGTCLRWAQSS